MGVLLFGGRRGERPLRQALAALLATLETMDGDGKGEYPFTSFPDFRRSAVK
jgi:hypothetical protein